MQTRKLLLATSANIIGNALAWYEFYLYILFTPLFAALFFAKGGSGAALLQALVVLAIGFISRPFGVIFLGHLGDRIGRKIALLTSILMMTIPTFLIGCIPTYAQIGIAAPILIAALRFLQGVPTGGEFTGAMCFLHEIAPVGKRAFLGSMVFFGSQLGAILSLTEFLLMDHFLSEHDLEEWGWRLSFLVGGLIGLAGWYLRSKLHETPVFRSLQHEGKILQRPVSDSFRLHKSALVKAMLLTALTASGWYLVFIFSPIYSSEMQHGEWGGELFVTLCLIILSNLCLPFFGWLADKGYRRALWIGSCIGTLLLAFPYYYFSMQDALGIFIAIKVPMAILLTVQFALLPSLLCELFPPEVRYSSVGIGYNVSTIIVGGFSPLLSLFLVNVTGNPYIPMFILMATAALSLFAMLMIKPSRV